MEAYRQFKTHYPDIKVGFSKFAELRPKECVLAEVSWVQLANEALAQLVNEVCQSTMVKSGQHWDTPVLRSGVMSMNVTEMNVNVN